jgi:hypothetical protein
MPQLLGVLNCRLEAGAPAGKMPAVRTNTHQRRNHGIMRFETDGARLNLQSFRESLAQAQPSDGLSLALQALWWDAKGDWERAHECAQERDDSGGMRVHAYLHRKEGDLSNADYWYRRCGVAPVRISLDEEWEMLARSLLLDA